MKTAHSILNLRLRYLPITPVRAWPLPVYIRTLKKKQGRSAFEMRCCRRQLNQRPSAEKAIWRIRWFASEVNEPRSRLELSHFARCIMGLI